MGRRGDSDTFVFQALRQALMAEGMRALYLILVVSSGVFAFAFLRAAPSVPVTGLIAALSISLLYFALGVWLQLRATKSLHAARESHWLQLWNTVVLEETIRGMALAGVVLFVGIPLLTGTESIRSVGFIFLAACVLAVLYVPISVVLRIKTTGKRPTAPLKRRRWTTACSVAGALGLVGAVALAVTGTISLRELVVQLLTVPLLTLAIWWLGLRSGIVTSPDEAQQATGERRPP